MCWFHCPSPTYKKSLCVCSIKLFPASMTYYIFLKFINGILSTYRQQSLDVSGHITAVRKTNLEADRVM